MHDTATKLLILSHPDFNDFFHDDLFANNETKQFTISVEKQLTIYISADKSLNQLLVSIMCR